VEDDMTKQRLASAAVSLVLAAGGLAVLAQPAGAVTYVKDSATDWRGFISTSSPLFGCGTDFVSQGTVTVHAPAGYGVQVYLVTHVYKWVDGAWQPQFTGTVHQNGQWVAAGQPYTFQQGWFATPSAGYYYAFLDVDFRNSRLQDLGEVFIKPNVASDWNAYYGYQGTGYSYCWHG
jgi:hypothetical protein